MSRAAAHAREWIPPRRRRAERCTARAVCTCVVAVLLGLIPHLAIARSQIAGATTETPGIRTSSLAQELEARHERQLRAGLVEDARRTEQELQELARAQNAKCREWWAFSDASARGAVGVLGILRTPKNSVKLADECLWRPGEPPVFRVTAVGRELELLSASGQWPRQQLFVEPALLGTADVELGQQMYVAVADAMVRYPGLADKIPTLIAAMRPGGDVAAAATALNELEQVASREPSTAIQQSLIVWILGFRAGLASSHGDLPAAVVHARAEVKSAERLFGAASVDVCPSLWRLASFLVANNDPQAAVETTARCLELAELRGRSSLTDATAFNNVAAMLHRTGALAEAVGSYGRSLALFQQAPPVPFNQAPVADLLRQQSLATVHANLGLAHWQRGDVAQAHTHFVLARQQMPREYFSTERSAVETFAKLATELDVLLTLEHAAQQLPGDRPSLALPLLLERKGFGLSAKAATVRALASNPNRLQEYRALLARRATLARASATTAEQQATREESVTEVDSQILLVEQEANRNAPVPGTGDFYTSDSRQAEYYAALSETMLRLSVEDDRRRRRRNDPSFFDDNSAAILRQAEAEIAPRFQDFLSSRARGRREGLLQSVQGKLTDNAALIEFVRFRPFLSRRTSDERWAPARYAAFVIRRTGTPVLTDLGDAAAMDELIADFRRALSQPRGTLAQDLGRRLDEELMQPVRTAIGAATEICVSPDGLLNLLPFGALVDEHDRYLLETVTFNYLPSARELLSERVTRSVRRTPPLIIANPAFDAGGASSRGQLRSVLGERFERLPGTADEAQALRAVLRDAVVFTEERATETALKSVASPRIVHLATHGFFLEDQEVLRANATRVDEPMLRSGLVFAGVNSGRSGNDDGILTALEAAALGLAGTELVVLSACETGVGDVKTGEGVYGLRRAMMAAGAETLVMSLWRVDDDATRQLMVDFYRRLASGVGRAEALRQASLAMLRDPTHRHPFYWASFISAGETGPLGP